MIDVRPTDSFWQRILQTVERLLHDIGSLMPPFAPNENSVSFTIALIALCAKLAKADGLVTRDEVIVFRSIIEIPPEEERNAARVFDLCRQEVTGFETYARQVHRHLGVGPRADERRIDVMDALFHIAMADGIYHEREKAFLEEVAAILAIPRSVFVRLESRHVPDAWDPWTVLEVPQDADTETVRAVWRERIRRDHPDRLIAAGAPREMIALATSRLQDLNRAYEEIMAGLAVQS